jgi:hypothetical protein
MASVSAVVTAPFDLSDKFLTVLDMSVISPQKEIYFLSHFS